jgi:hypothetical protein
VKKIIIHNFQGITGSVFGAGLGGAAAELAHNGDWVTPLLAAGAGMLIVFAVFLGCVLAEKKP